MLKILLEKLSEYIKMWILASKIGGYNKVVENKDIKNEYYIIYRLIKIYSNLTYLFSL